MLGKAMKFNKATKILSVGLLLHLPIVAQAATPSKLVSTEITVVDSNGYPVENGEYTWKTLDGLTRSAKVIEATALGVVQLNSIPSKEVDLQFDRGRLSAEGYCVSFKTTFTPVMGKMKIVLPDYDRPIVRNVAVKLPSGHPVPNAIVDSRNLAGGTILESETLKLRISGTGGRDNDIDPEPNRTCYRGLVNPGETFYLGGGRDGVVTNGVSNADGIVTLKGWSTSAISEVQATFNDGVLYQKTPSVQINPDGPTTLTLDYFPILRISSDDIDASMNQLVSLPVSVVDSADIEPMSFSRFISEPRLSRASFVGKPSAAFAGVQVEVVSPPSSKAAKCTKKQTLKAKTTSSGKALLKVCVTTSGNYQIKGKGAVSLGKVSIHVKGAAPMAPTALSTRPGAKKATVAWGLPTYSGGSPILKYVVTATSSGQKTKKIEVKANTTAFKSRKLDITGLTAPKNWQISVVAVTKNGESEKASVFVNVPNK
jgi:hypothetical protein